MERTRGVDGRGRQRVGRMLVLASLILLTAALPLDGAARTRTRGGSVTQRTITVVTRTAIPIAGINIVGGMTLDIERSARSRGFSIVWSFEGTELTSGRRATASG